MRLVTLGLCLFFCSIGFLARSSEIDSLRVIVTPVQCYGLRNGMIHVDTVFGGQKPYFYSLDGQTFTTNPTFDRLWAGEYTLYVHDALGALKNMQVVISEPPELLLKLSVSATKVLAGEPFNVRALASVETEFLQNIEWSPAALFPQQDTIRQTVSISESTRIFVSIQDQNGCAESADQLVEVEPTNLYLPNIIKPGSATNAYFTVFAGEGVRRVASLRVFSRGGSVVFERFDFQPNAPLLGWGGRWNGKWAQAGVYPYMAVVEFLDGKQRRFEGTVTVVN